MSESICVAAPLEMQVVKDIFLSVYVPYSVVRGEQIELKGSVYNYRASAIKFCVKIAAGNGICAFGDSATSGPRKHGCNFKNLGGGSLSPVTFRILPLELGLHTINFTLLTAKNSETVVKTLRVMPEGIKKEIHAGFTLDPQGVYGSIKRRQEFRYKVPLNLVPKTKIDRSVSVKGHLMGEAISTVLSPSGVSALTSLPKGSAEAEFMSIAPVFYVFRYLEESDNWHLLGSETLTARTQMRRKMKEGIVSILSFRNSDFSYSMWKDGQASTWLTAFALRILAQVNQYINLNEVSICNSLLWLIDNCQMPDGSFSEFANYQPVKLQDTINALEALTEYSLLVKRLDLDMSVKVAYKNYGDLNLFKLTEDNFVGRTLTVPLEDDIYVSTGSSTGIATVNVRTVYNTIGTSEESCNFELKIVPKRVDAECSKVQERLDRSVTVDARREAACQNDIAYAIVFPEMSIVKGHYILHLSIFYKVNILSRSEEGYFVKYSATLLDLYKRGQAFAKKNDEITFVKKKTCTDVELSPGEQYLMMGKEALKISIGYNFNHLLQMAEKTTRDPQNVPGSSPDENEFPFGYPTNICEDVPDQKYLCSNCNNVLKKALQTLCGHRYCSACLSWIVRTNKNVVCQKCKEEDPSTLSEGSLLAEERAFGDAAINKEISELKVHCMTLGCSWSGIMKNFEEHQSLCEYALIPCHTGCGHMVMRKKLADHLENGCVNNVTMCQKCKRSLSSSEYQVRTFLSFK
ncbi:complement c5 [Limosa lapponica baueri]|uniref:Complement c5 n=1 Tax=Limosa lapponica baueri TaxID=1758121 RepID=A0A2I0TUI0_LIMLA|nr:complement c5 [Limosa lapponica baueri]